jgi:tetrahydromethanopterin S-methyltransferase subunit G
MRAADTALQLRGNGVRESDPDDSLERIHERLDRLARDVDEIKRELRRAQAERLEDLTLVVDLMATSWRAVDRRLSTIDAKLDRLHGTPVRGRSRLP